MKSLTTHVKEMHDEACKNGEEFYIDPVTGYRVATSFFLMMRGWCCELGCRHCPYGDKK